MNAPEVDRTSADLRLHGMLRLDFTGTSQSETSKAQLAEIETKLASCNAEIHDLQSRLELLHQRRTRLETQKAYLNSLSSVTRRLPNEILLQFFDYASEMNDLTSNSLRTMPALAISAASSRFRQLAYSFPRIWSRLRLNLTLRHLQPFPLLKHYLDASRQTLLTLELGGTNLLPLAPLTAYSILAACSDRWAQLTISNWFIYQNLVTQNDAMHFPALEQLALPNLYMNDPTLLEHFEHASNLRTFAFAEIHMEDRRNGFPWEQLTVLDCAHYNDEVKEIVEICSNLEELRFRWFYHEEEDAEDDPLSGYFVSSVTIPALKVLSLLLGQQSDLSEHERLANVIFMSLTCPSLTSLVIEGGADFNHPWPREETNTCD
ncbi:hypothetical protein GYMLUDRAFT_385492 [Collybiopsis luxurians FD-317 M1]|nr:hypothetical protein GYMLUDRAFT_385492 [Collybiopsis luxurians FD-317 M1]